MRQLFTSILLFALGCVFTYFAIQQRGLIPSPSEGKKITGDTLACDAFVTISMSEHRNYRNQLDGLTTVDISREHERMAIKIDSINNRLTMLTDGDLQLGSTEEPKPGLVVFVNTDALLIAVDEITPHGAKITEGRELNTLVLNKQNGFGILQQSVPSAWYTSSKRPGGMLSYVICNS